MTPAPGGGNRLRKELGLFDVYAISTGAMFSSGFFLLPGLAAAQTGPSVPLAYLLASIFILPALLSVAELATAMPRAGGAYYFLDRSMGPLVGTVGGLGTWLALVLKSAFALVGMGAYLAIYVEVPIQPLAIGLTILFATINVVGAKETGGIQRMLVAVLLAILAFFIVQGLVEVFSLGVGRVTAEQFTPFLPFGFGGLMATVGLVFVSYAGLTKVASVAEEVEDPERNIPLGMILSLASAAFVYAVGVYLLVAVLPAAELRADLTPVATAAAAFFDWLPWNLGVMLIVVAAIAAFASTGNAGILSASRYPLAMARDRLVPSFFGQLGRFHTPLVAIVVTAATMVAAILFLDIQGIAKLASAFQLLLFALLNLAVIIMRESRIEGYDPGFRTPLYPWMQIFGFLAPGWLIAEMGNLAILFTLGLIALTIGWYFYYARPRVVRSGAIFHTFARLGELRHGGLDVELQGIVKEKGLREEDPYEEVVARAPVLDLDEEISFQTLAGRASDVLAQQFAFVDEGMREGFLDEARAGFMPVARGAAMPHIRRSGIDHPEMLLVRCRGGVRVEEEALRDQGEEALARGGAEEARAAAEALDMAGAEAESDVDGTEAESGTVGGEAESDVSDTEAEGAGTELDQGEETRHLHAVFFLVSPESEPALHLRLLGHLAVHVDEPAFLERWLAARNEQELKDTLLREERSLSLRLRSEGPTADWIGLEIRDLDLPADVLIALIRRSGRGVVPRGSTVLREADQLTVLGTPQSIRELGERFGEK